jgi:serine/threonine protein kinase
MQFRFPQFAPTPLSQIITNASPEAIQLITDLLLYDPQQRPTASASLQYPFFQVNNALPPPESQQQVAQQAQQPQASTFIRRPVQKTEAEIKAEERMMAKKMQEELEHGEKVRKKLNSVVFCRLIYNTVPFLCMVGSSSRNQSSSRSDGSSAYAIYLCSTTITRGTNLGTTIEYTRH